MVYNRYIPDSQGIYRHHRITMPDPVCEDRKKEEAEQIANHVQSCPIKGNTNIDLGDVLLLCIAILILLEADSEDMMSIIVAVIAFVFLQ